MADHVPDRVQLAKELEIVRGLSKDGKLHPEDIVAWARNNKTSALYQDIDKNNGWDDAAAAEAYRVQLARNIIRVVIKDVDYTPTKVRAYISVPTDRQAGGGYTTTEEALRESRLQLIDEAINKLRTLGNQFTYLPELAPLFDEVRKAALAFRQGLLKKPAVA